MPKTDQGEVYRAGRPALGARLCAAAKMVDTTRAVADIGCDHGKLAVWLAMSGAPYVAAVDSRPMPLEKAKALVRQCGCGARVECLLGNGLGAVVPGAVAQVVIAGLGGEVSAGILAACAWVAVPGMRLVLVPTTRHAHLRCWLCGHGFEIAEEQPVLEKGRPYTAIRAEYTGRVWQPDALFCEVGRLAGQHGPAAQAYVAARLAALEKAGRAPMDAARRAAHNQLMEELSACLR